MDMIGRHYLFLDSARYVVLDEADEMLDLGFLEDVETILGRCPSGRQTALFSATMPPEIKKLAEKRMYDPVTIKVKAATLTIDTVAQFHVEVQRQGQARQAGRGDPGGGAHRRRSSSPAPRSASTAWRAGSGTRACA